MRAALSKSTLSPRVIRPWSGRNRALGLEPITGAFDYGAAVSAAPNPLAARGAATTVHIEPGQEVVMRHRVTVGRL